jgi:transposase-like protein
MAQLNITLNQEEILQLLSTDRNTSFAKLLQDSLNSVLQAESAAQLHAEPYERTEERTGCRNGFRDRELTTRLGTITLHVPKHRDGEPFRTMIFDNYTRSEAALVATMAEMVVNGVSTRKVSRVMETLCGKNFSKSSVSQVCKELDEKVQAFRTRPLTVEYPFITLDATYFKVRQDTRVVSSAFLVAYATNTNGYREIIGFGVYSRESKDTWNEFLLSLRKRGLAGVKMITSDAHEGIRYAIRKQFPEVPWQRCQFHYAKNVIDKAPKKYQAGLRTEIQEMFLCRSLSEAIQRKDAILADYSDVAASAMNCLEEGFESAMTVMLLPAGLRRYYRTSNHIERLNKELKRRSKVIGIFPNDDSLLRLMGSVLIELHEAMQAGRAIFSKDSLAALMKSDVPAKLIVIAGEQQQLRAA